MDDGEVELAIESRKRMGTLVQSWPEQVGKQAFLRNNRNASKISMLSIPSENCRLPVSKLKTAISTYTDFKKSKAVMQ